MRWIYRGILACATCVVIIISIVALKFFTLGKKAEQSTFDSYLLQGIGGADSASVQLTFLGTSSFIFENDKDAILIDPFFSNPSLLRPTHKKKWEDIVSKHTIRKLSLIAITHGHYDHCYDLTTLLPYCSSDIQIVGDMGIYNQLFPVVKEYKFVKIQSQESEWIYSRDSSFRVKSFPSQHLPHLGTLEFLAGTYLHPVEEIPSALFQWKKCGCYNYMIDILEDDIPIKRSVLIGGTVHEEVLEKMNEEHKKFPVSMLMHIMWKQSLNISQIEYIQELWHPKDVVLFHWNNFFTSLDRPLQYFRSSKLPETLGVLRKENVPAKVMMPFTYVYIK